MLGYFVSFICKFCALPPGGYNSCHKLLLSVVRYSVDQTSIVIILICEIITQNQLQMSMIKCFSKFKHSITGIFHLRPMERLQPCLKWFFRNAFRKNVCICSFYLFRVLKFLTVKSSCFFVSCNKIKPS